MEACDGNCTGALRSCRAPGFVSLGLQGAGCTLQAVLVAAVTQQFWLVDGPSGLSCQTSSWTLGQMANSSFSSFALRKPRGRKEETQRYVAST